MAPPKTFPTYAPLVWDQRIRQACYDRAARPERTPLGQCQKALHINAYTFLRLIGPCPPGPLPSAAAAAGSALAAWAHPAVRRNWPTWPLKPMLGPTRATVALQSVLLDGTLRVVAGRWQDGAQAPPQPSTPLRQIIDGGLLVLPQWALAAGAAGAARCGLGSLACGLRSAAAMCPRLAACLRLARDGHRALCALPLAASAFVLGLTIDCWLIGWRSFQGTTRCTESYLFAPCAPPEAPLGCLRAEGAPALAPASPPSEEPAVDADAGVDIDLGPDGGLGAMRAAALRRHVHSFLKLDHDIETNLHLRGLLFEHVDVQALIKHLDSDLQHADTPGQRHLYPGCEDFVRAMGPEIERLGERWLAYPQVSDTILAEVKGSQGLGLRSWALSHLKQRLALAGPHDERSRFVSAEINAAETDQSCDEAELEVFKTRMRTEIEVLKSCWAIATLPPGESDWERLELLLTTGAAVAALFDLCAQDLDRLLQRFTAFEEARLDPTLERPQLDTIDYAWFFEARVLWRAMGRQHLPKKGRSAIDLRLPWHSDRLGRLVQLREREGHPLTPEQITQMKRTTDVLFHLMGRLQKVVRLADGVLAGTKPVVEGPGRA